MMETKDRRFLPLAHPLLEDLVPAGHFYRHLERTLDPDRQDLGQVVVESCCGMIERRKV